jgi:hypothetical protein
MNIIILIIILNSPDPSSYNIYNTNNTIFNIKIFNLFIAQIIIFLMLILLIIIKIIIFITQKT